MIQTLQEVPKSKWITFLILIITAVLLSYADRTIMAITIIPIGDEYSWPERTRGLVLGSFFLGYLCTQIVGGWLSDRLLGGGPVLLIGVGLWSAIILLSPLLIAGLGMGGAVVGRIGLGMAEGIGYPAIHSMLNDHIPPHWINTAVGGVNGASYVGGAASLLIAAPMAAFWGWPSVFLLFGALGLLWLIPWTFFLIAMDYSLGKDDDFDTVEEAAEPVEEAMSPTSKRRIVRPAKSEGAPARAKAAAANPKLRDILSKRPVWAMFVCYYCNNWGFWIIFSWLPTFFRHRFGASLEDLGLISVLPLAMQGVTGLLAGVACDSLLRKNMVPKRTLRLAAQGIAMVGPAACLLSILLLRESQAAALLLLTMAMAFNSLSSVGVGVNHFDLAPRHAGFLYGLLNSVGVVPGLLGVPIAGWMVEHWGWSPVFVVAILHYLFGYAVWVLFGAFTVQLH